MSANVGLAIQCVGILLVALLSMSMRGSIKSASLKCWTRAWLSLSVALMSLFAGFHIVPGHRLLYSVYFFGEYAFGLMFIGGCRYLASGAAGKPNPVEARLWLERAIGQGIPDAEADLAELTAPLQQQ